MDVAKSGREESFGARGVGAAGRGQQRGEEEDCGAIVGNEGRKERTVFARGGEGESGEHGEAVSECSAHSVGACHVLLRHTSPGYGYGYGCGAALTDSPPLAPSFKCGPSNVKQRDNGGSCRNHSGLNLGSDSDVCIEG